MIYLLLGSPSHIIEKMLDKGYNFALDFTSIRSLHKKLWASKIVKVPISKKFGLLTWESHDKMTFGCNPHGQAQRTL